MTSLLRSISLPVLLLSMLPMHTADACSWATGWDLQLPLPDSVDVPTDVEIVLNGIGHRTVLATLRVEGIPAEVPTTRVYLPNGAAPPVTTLLRPTALLQPNTAYTLTVTRGTQGEATRRFRTGAGPATATPPGVAVRGAQAVEELRDGCGNNHLACLAVDTTHAVEVTTRRRRDNAITGQLVYSATADILLGFATRFSQDPLCFEVRARDLAGHLGPTTPVCPPPEEVAVIPLYTGGDNMRLACREGRLYRGDQIIARADAGPLDSGLVDSGVVTDDGPADVGPAMDDASPDAGRDAGVSPLDVGRDVGVNVFVDVGAVPIGDAATDATDAADAPAGGEDTGGGFCTARPGSSGRRTGEGWLVAGIVAVAAARRRKRAAQATGR